MVKLLIASWLGCEQYPSLEHGLSKMATESIADLVEKQNYEWKEWTSSSPAIGVIK